MLTLKDGNDKKGIMRMRLNPTALQKEIQKSPDG